MQEEKQLQVKKYIVDQFMRSTRMTGISFSHDEQDILVTCNNDGIPNAYTIPVAGGPAHQLTFSKDEPIKALSYFPNDRRVLYLQDRGGIENRHLCVLEENGRRVFLTKGERVRSGFQGWSIDGKHFYCISDERAENHFDVYKVDASTYERSMIFRDEEGYLLVNTSLDGRYATFLKCERSSDSSLHLFDLETRSLDPITPRLPNTHYLSLFFDLDSRHLQYQASECDDTVTVYQYDVETRIRHRVAGWPSKFRRMFISNSRRYRALIVDEREGAKIHLHDYFANSPVILESLPRGNVTSVAISKSDRFMAFYLNSDRQPNDLHVYELSTGRMRKLTNNLSPEISVEDLVESESMSFKSFDGLDIPCLMWRPKGSTALNPAPALVWVHGGPIGQIRKGYAGAVQFLVNHGYVVLGVNHRGSTGYGRSFMNAADRKQGREPLWDCVEARRYLATVGYVDSSRIGIIGGSFGGYMALAALTFHPVEFAVGVAICGISNLIRHLEAKFTDPHLRAIYLDKVGDPHNDREMLETISPLFHAENIRKPLMVLHGANDPRADKAESDDIVKAVRANGGIVEYLEFDDEAHGFRKRANSIRAYRAILLFLDKYLKGSD